MTNNYKCYNTLQEIVQGKNIAREYSKGNIVGWGGPELARDAFKVVGHNFHTFSNSFVKNARGGKMFLYQVVRKVLGEDTPNYPQQIGDCVSFGAKNATEYLTCCEMLMKGERQKYRAVFPPYYYGTGRVYVGNGQLGNEDGSLGSWMASAVMKYGTLFSDENDVPKYAGNIAKAWGGPSGRSHLDKWKPTASNYLVKSAAQIRGWDDLVAAIVNGYPCTVASNQGFSMEPDGRGFHRPQGNWGHQMCFIGVDDEYSEPYALIVNSWGDVHGNLKNFHESGEELPVGVLRCPKATAVKMIQAGETFAFSQFDGFPEQDLNEALFKVVGG